ncbi:tetratricopeptide repeat protein [Chloroflexus sp.]|uniref:tetratricopeptide repeat protein n=1 Tax=Chloroflexus sp. TaxID=1904827 RepID=UPI002ADDC2C8|nr:tetratricopeptide repeat protein [Chloroflexus sp.]
MSQTISQIIQRQASLGDTITLELKTGKEFTGVITEIGTDHITINRDEEIITIFLDSISGYRVKQIQPLVKSADSSPSKIDNSVASPVSSSKPIETKKDDDEPQKIKSSIEEQIQNSTISFHTPDFTLPLDEIKDIQQKEIIKTAWDRIENKYKYANKINELDPKFGRIQSIINELQTLVDRFPGLFTTRRLLGYLYWYSRNYREAFELYYQLAFHSNYARDWYNLAVLAGLLQEEELTCYALEHFFYSSALEGETTAWFFYVKLIQKYSNYRALKNLIESRGKKFSDKEHEILFKTSIYILISINNEKIATTLIQRQQNGDKQFDLVKEALNYLDMKPDSGYQDRITQLSSQRIIETNQRNIHHQPQGYVYKYNPYQKFGFLKGTDGVEYFFHRSAVSDDDLLNRLKDFTSGKQIPVTFEVAQGPKGPLAIGVTLYRTIDEMFNRATEFADEGDYPKAIAQIKKVIDLNPDYPSAREYYEKWREYARISGVPRGTNPYARAKRAQLIEKDFEKAVRLLQEAINKGDNIESAIKDLASLLVQQGKAEEAVWVLEQYRRKIRDQKSVDNMLIGFYQNAGQYDSAITLLEGKLSQAMNESKKTAILWQIANCHLRKEDYVQAERTLRKVLEMQPDNKIAQRNIAICLFKQMRYDEAKSILNQILTNAHETQALELLEAIKQAQITGQFARFDAIVRDALVTELIVERSRFTEFLLNRCEYRGLSPDRIRKGDDGRKIYIGSKRDARHDIERLEDIARQLGTRRPSERADYYLTAARITESDDSNQFYQYLCRSFSSKGDSFLTENKPLDSARELYSESLAVYDGYRNPVKGEDKYDEQDAVNALVRYLYSWLGRDSVPTVPPKSNEQDSVLKQQLQYIDDALEEVISKHPQREKVFDAISYLIFRSKYAGERILRSLYSRSSLQALSINFLQRKGVTLPGSLTKIDEFIALWNEYQRKRSKKIRFLIDEIRILSNIDIYPASLENSIERLKTLTEHIFLDLDKQRLEQIRNILELSLDLCKHSTFEEQERLCLQIDSRCQDLLKEIENSPTKLSVEEMYAVIETIQKKIKARLDDLYISSTPQITLRLPVETYTPDTDRRIEVQIVVSNRVGCSPAESLELVIQEYEDSFTVPLYSSLRGGDQRIIKVPILVEEDVLHAQAFSLPVYAKYRIRTGDTIQTEIQSFAIRLGTEHEFQEIENPYAAYAEGGIVSNPDMFFGRDELIANIAKTLQSSYRQSKCVIIYGQKRAGKSSILYHLKTRLQSNKDILILDVGNIGSILDEQSNTPFLYQILWAILKKLAYTIEDEIVERGRPEIKLDLPGDQAFFNHPSPLSLFKDVFERFRRTTAKLPEWRNIRLVLIIDEFSYIYQYIVRGLISETFMMNWKALLQENYFHAVLAGQDVMPKFKQRFPNEFGTTQDERVTYLRREDAIKLIDEPIRIGGRSGESRYRERAIDRILDLTAGSPFYIQILCNRLVEYMNRKRASLVTEADVDQVKDELIKGVNALTLDKFDNLISSGDTSEDAISDDDALKVLAAIALHSKTGGPCNRNSIVCQTHTPLDTILEDLVKRDVIERVREQYYSLRVGLFKEWLIANQ